MSDPREQAHAGFLLLQGRGTSPGVGCGPLLRNHPELEPASAEGAVLVAERATPEDVGRILVSAGTVTLGGAVLSHVSMLSMEFGKPSVSLGGESRVRILPPGENGLLELSDVVGGEGPPLVQEGDVVLLDGDRGTVSIPGGTDAKQRRRVRRVHDRLIAFRSDPDSAKRLRELTDSAGPADGPAFAYLLEAALVHRLLPTSTTTRRLLEALAGDPVREGRLRSILGRMRERVTDRARESCSRAREHVGAARVLDDLERQVRGLRERIDCDRVLMEDLGGDARALDDLLSLALERAAERREALRRELRSDVARALELPDDILQHRIGGLHQLLRRARNAGLETETVESLQARLAKQVAEERARAGHHLVVSLDVGTPQERSLVGGKAAGLMRARPILPEGCRIPEGHVVTSAAYRLHLLGEPGERLRAIFETGGDETAISRKARAAILSAEIPEEVTLAVETAITGYGSRRLAIRSSATVEDGPAGSLAGQFDSVLGVTGLPDVLDRIRWAWASLWNARALRTFAAMGQSPLGASQAVLIQEVVETRAAGVLVTRDQSGRPDTFLVNSAWGLGGGISQGKIPGDLFWVRRSTGELIASERGGGRTRVQLDPDRPETVEVPLDEASDGMPSLSGDDLVRLATLARALDEATGRAQDVEFGFAEDGTLVIFQVRRVVSVRRN